MTVSINSYNSLVDYALAIVRAKATDEKVSLAKKASQSWHKRRLSAGIKSRYIQMPDRPGRPQKPELLPPKAMPKRTTGGQRGRIALLHSLAHIELNAIDMTWDLIARFYHSGLPISFLDDWVRVGVEEAKHFELLERRLGELDSAYGDLPAHDGLWQSAQNTGNDMLARIAIVPLVLEARGLDVSPAIIEKLEKAEDFKSARVLQIIYNDEKFHVSIGYKWFRYLCERQELSPEPTFHRLVREYFRGQIKPPFNDSARSEAGLTPGFYRPLVAVL